MYVQYYIEHTYTKKLFFILKIHIAVGVLYIYLINLTVLH